MRNYTLLPTYQLYELRKMYDSRLEVGGGVLAPDDYRAKIAAINKVLRSRGAK